jgi:hypothetical protein
VPGFALASTLVDLPALLVTFSAISLMDVTSGTPTLREEGCGDIPFTFAVRDAW